MAIKTYLARYSEAGDGLYAIIKQCNAIIINRPCAQFLLGEHTAPLWQPGQLDLCVARDKYYTLRDSLRALHETSFLDEPAEEERNRQFTALLLVGKIIYSITCSENLSPYHPLAQTSGTHLYNFVGPNMLCIPYPHLFFQRHAVTRLPPSVYTSNADWLSHGFRFSRSFRTWETTSRVHECLQHGQCSGVRRYFGDEHCLSCVYSSPNDLQHYPTWTTCWVRGGLPCEAPYCEYHVKPTAVSAMLHSSTASLTLYL